MKRSDFDDAEWGRILQQRYDQMAQLHADGVIDEHPIEGFNRDSATLRRVARDAAGSGLGARELEEEDQPKAQDDPPEHTPGTPPGPDRPGAALAARDRRIAADEAREELAIRQSGAPDVEARLQLARARRSNPARVRAVDAAIPGYGRLK